MPSYEKFSKILWCKVKANIGLDIEAKKFGAATTLLTFRTVKDIVGVKYNVINSR